MHMKLMHTCRHILQYTLIPTVYRALLNSAVSGTDHRMYTTKKTTWIINVTVTAVAIYKYACIQMNTVSGHRAALSKDMHHKGLDLSYTCEWMCCDWMR